MTAGDPALIEFIGDRIRHGGPVPFRWFMEQALYHPQHGYYASGKAVIGRRGDYFTSVSVGPLFGRLLASQFREMWEHMGNPISFTIVEQGANNGDFARDVLTAAQETDPRFFSGIHYTVIEPFQILRERQRKTLEAFPRVEWHAGLDELTPFNGIHFSNELLDAMPAHLVIFKEGAWKERHVDWKDGRFEFTEGPVSSGRLARHLTKLPPVFPENYTTEINLDALDWLESLSSRLVSGYVLAVDYGYPRDILYESSRHAGTLACYSKHTRNYDPLQNAGDSDITAHVDFTSLAECAIALGFRVAGFTDQHHFMVGLGKSEFAEESGAPDAGKAKALREFKTLMHPNFMGLGFKFLALEKNLPAGSARALAGFQFASEPAAALGVR